MTHLCISKLEYWKLDPWEQISVKALIEIYTFSFKKMHLEMSSGKWKPSCLGLNVLRKYKRQINLRHRLLERGQNILMGTIYHNISTQGSNIMGVKLSSYTSCKRPVMVSWLVLCQVRPTTNRRAHSCQLLQRVLTKGSSLIITLHFRLFERCLFQILKRPVVDTMKNPRLYLMNSFMEEPIIQGFWIWMVIWFT